MAAIRNTARCLALLAVGLIGAGCATMPKTSGDFADVTKEMKSVAVMPASVSLTQQGAFTGQQMPELTHDVEREIERSMGSLIQESRYRLGALDFSDSALAADPEMRTAIFDQQQAMADVFNQLAQSKSKKIEIPYKASLDLIADRAGSDHLFFVAGSGTFQSTGAQVKEAVIAGVAALFGAAPTMGPVGTTTLAGVLVDANRGKVVWYNRVLRETDPRKPGDLMVASQQLTKPLLGPSKLKADHSRDQEIIKKYSKLGKSQPPTPSH